MRILRPARIYIDASNLATSQGSKPGLTPRGKCSVVGASREAGESQSEKTAQQSQVGKVAHYLFCDLFGWKDHVTEPVDIVHVAIGREHYRTRRDMQGSAHFIRLLPKPRAFGYDCAIVTAARLRTFSIAIR